MPRCAERAVWLMCGVIDGVLPTFIKTCIGVTKPDCQKCIPKFRLKSPQQIKLVA